MGEIALDGLVKTFPGGVQAVAGIDLTVQDGEFLVLVGPSGCGKTTLLRMIGGLEEVTEGSIVIGGRDVTWAQPGERDIAMVFQNYALYPHMTVRRNLGYALRVRRTPKQRIREQVDGVAALLMLEELLERRPAALSGGQRQRVAMGRAMVREPAAFLMDEPLSNLDAKLRVMMRAELARLHRRLGITTVYVTHDQVEAMTLGQRVAIMRDGVVQQVGPPQQLYAEPANLFVAAFIGSPGMNLVEADVADGVVTIAGHRITLPFACPIAGRVIVGIRPEAFEDAEFAPAGLATIDVEVDVIEELGADVYVFFPLDAPRIDAAALRAAADGEEGRLLAGERAIVTARVDPRSAARPGDRLRLALDPSRFHFFDADDGSIVESGRPSVDTRDRTPKPVRTTT